MSADFWIGLAALPTLAIVLAASAWLLVGARKAWHAIHTRLLWQRVELRADPRPVHLAPWNKTKGDRESYEPTYEREADRIRDALVRVPRMRLIAGFGWYIAIIRDFTDVPATSGPSTTNDTA